MPEAIAHASWFDWIVVAFVAVGGWATVRWLFRLAIRELLGGEFARKSDVDGLGGRVTGLTTLFTQLRDTIDDDVKPRLESLESANEFQFTPLIERFNAFEERQDERDRSFADWREELARTLGGIEGELRTMNGNQQRGS